MRRGKREKKKRVQRNFEEMEKASREREKKASGFREDVLLRRSYDGFAVIQWLPCFTVYVDFKFSFLSSLRVVEAVGARDACNASRHFVSMVLVGSNNPVMRRSNFLLKR